MLLFSKLKIAIILTSCLAGVLFALPNLLTEKQLQSWPSFLPGKQIVLGLDLRGGAHLVLQVDTAAVVKDQLEVLRADIRRALRKAKISYSGGLKIIGNSIITTIHDTDKHNAAKKQLHSLVKPVGASILKQTVHNNMRVDIDTNNVLTISLTSKEIEAISHQATEQSIEVLRSRIDALGTTEPLLVRHGKNRILVEVPGHSDTTELKEILARTAKMSFHLVKAIGQQAIDGKIASDVQLFYSKPDPSKQDDTYPILVNKEPLLSGSDLISATVQFDNTTREPVVGFRFNSYGAKKFARITRENIGRMLAVVLDNEVITFPRINATIPGGNGVISGNFTTQSASNLALLLRTGALPTSLSILEERIVGASLGTDSIRSGKIAALIGTLGVSAYMALNYGLFGMFANLSVIINLILTIAILSILRSTLTLPGIAGIVLGVGMVVDANVLIYERIREEQMLGHSPAKAIETGFKKVLGTIFDANSTHVLAALVLFYFGSGPIKGFALTLTISILISYVTAISVTRMFITQWFHWARPKKIPL